MLWYVRILRIDGDYALCRREDDPDGEPFPVARALLPEAAEAGMRLRCENFCYAIDE